MPTRSPSPSPLTLPRPLPRARGRGYQHPRHLQCDEPTQRRHADRVEPRQRRRLRARSNAISPPAETPSARPQRPLPIPSRTTSGQRSSSRNSSAASTMHGSRNNPTADAVPNSAAHHTVFTIPTSGSAARPAARPPARQRRHQREERARQHGQPRAAMVPADQRQHIQRIERPVTRDDQRHQVGRRGRRIGMRGVAAAASRTSSPRPQRVMADAPLGSVASAEQSGRRQEEQPPAARPKRCLAAIDLRAGSRRSPQRWRRSSAANAPRCGGNAGHSSASPPSTTKRSSSSRISPWLGITPPVKKCCAIQSALSSRSKRYGIARWLNTCRNSNPCGSSQPCTRASNAGQFEICSNISTDTTRSNRASVSNTFMSAVSTRTLRQATPRRLRLDMRPLRTRVGHRDDLRAGKPLRHPQRQRAPAAAQFQHALPVVQSGMRGGLRQRAFLRLGQRRVRRRTGSTNISAAGPGCARRTPAAARNAARWHRQDAARSDTAPSPAANSRSAAGSACCSRRLVRSTSSAMPARVTLSGNGNAFDRTGGGGDKIHDDLAGGSGMNALTRAWYSRYASPRDRSICCSSGGTPET